jgi:hypothetical protein
VGWVVQRREKTVDSFTQNTALSTKVNSAAVLGNKFGPKSDSFTGLRRWRTADEAESLS